MKYHVRFLEERDLDTLLELERRIPEAPHWSRVDYERCLASDPEASPRRAGFVAESEGRLLGFAVGKLVAGTCELESIAVVEEARKQGIGIALIQSLVTWARSAGASRLELEVRVSNYRAIGLYERLGMFREGLRHGYYQAPDEDAVLMEMALMPGGKLP